jgi:hypothetical protein
MPRHLRRVTGPKEQVWTAWCRITRRAPRSSSASKPLQDCEYHDQPDAHNDDAKDRGQDGDHSVEDGLSIQPDHEHSSDHSENRDDREMQTSACGACLP